jgi:hypothetical protein
VEVTNREPSDPEGKLMRTKSRKHVRAEAGARVAREYETA